MPSFKDLKCTTKLYLQVAILWPYDTHAKYQLVKCSGIHRKKNFEIVFEFKSDKAVLTFSFHFLSFPLLSLFLPFFFSCWAFRRLHFGGQSFWESFYNFRIT